MATFTAPAQNRAPGSYGPFGPVLLGAADNSVLMQFSSSDWTTSGGRFVLHCDRLPAGASTWIPDDFRGEWDTGGVDKNDQPNIPVVRYDVPPGDQVRARYDVSGRTINLGVTITTSAKA